MRGANVAKKCLAVTAAGALGRGQLIPAWQSVAAESDAPGEALRCAPFPHGLPPARGEGDAVAPNPSALPTTALNTQRCLGAASDNNLPWGLPQTAHPRSPLLILPLLSPFAALRSSAGFSSLPLSVPDAPDTSASDTPSLSDSDAPPLASPGAPKPNSGILVELGILPPYDPNAEAEAQKKEVIYAARRAKAGKIICKRERQAGRVPSVLFQQAGGHIAGNKELISVDRRQVAALLRKYGRSRFLSRSFEMRIIEAEDPAVGEILVQVMRVLPKSVHEHCVSDELLNVTFLKMPAEEGARVKVDVPLQFLGEDTCPGIRKGGWLFCMRRVVPCEVPWDKIPPYIEVDLSELGVGDIVRLHDLKVDPACRLLIQKMDLPVCKIAGSRSLQSASD